MDIYFINKCDELFNNLKITSNYPTYFNNYDEYFKIQLNNVFFIIQQIINSKKQTQVGTVSNIIPIYNIDETVDSDNLMIEYNGEKLNELDLLLIGNSYVFISDTINFNKISIQLVNSKNKFEESSSIYKICNFKKYYRIYKSLHQLKNNKLRNFYIPCNCLTKLMKSKLKSDFWNQEQRNIISSVIKITENKKIHVINGPKKSGKSTLILGLIQNYLSRFANTKLLITSSNNQSLYQLANRLIIQSSILLPQNQWFMIVGDINYIDKELHSFVISTYVEKYKTTLNFIDNELKKLSDPLIDNEPILINIKNKLEQLPVEPYSHSNTTITNLFDSCKNQSDIDFAASQAMIIIDKWTKSSYINTKLILHCNLIISSICSSGCDSMELYENKIILIDDAEQMPEIESLIPLQDSTEQLILFGNNINNENNKNIFYRMIKGGSSIQNLNEQYL